MFFQAKEFEHYGVTSAVSEHVAKVANALIDQKGKVLYGQAHANGDFWDLSSIRKVGDTHVMMAMGAQPIDPKVAAPHPAEMPGQAMPEIRSPDTTITDNDQIKQLLERLAFLEKEVGVRTGAYHGLGQTIS